MASLEIITEVSQLDPYLVRKYITACHILHYHDLVDAYGHISVRLSSTTFLMSRYLAPALVTSPSDLVIYRIEGAVPISPNAPRGFSERFIHSEIYAAYPNVTSVIHSHALSVVPFSISSQPLCACFHMAGFLGRGVPVWDFDTVYSSADQQDMLVRNAKLGASLAKALGEGAEGKSQLSNAAQSGSLSGEGSSGQLKHVVALMRGHGMVVVAESMEMVVLRAIYTAQNARVLMGAKGLGGEVKVFTEKEAADTANTTGMGAVKPWPLWKREVENSGLYQNLG